MMKFDPRGIRQRAIFLAVVPTAVIAAVLTASFLILRYLDIEAELQSRGKMLVRQLAPAAQYGVFARNRGELLRITRSLALEPDVVAVRIFDANGLLLAASGAEPPQAKMSSAKMPSVETFNATIDRPEVMFADLFHDNEPVSEPQDSHLGTIAVELSRESLEVRKREIFGVTILATGLILIFALLLARRLGKDITEPVLALEHAVGRIHDGQQGVRIQPHPSRTLAAIESGFNEMAAALDAMRQNSKRALAKSEEALAHQLLIAESKKREAETAYQTKSRFLAAASHDIRQPLHALTSFATELASSESNPRNRQLASQIVKAAGAMSELLESLLDMSRLDIATIEPNCKAIALEPLLEMCAESHQNSAAVKGLRLRCRPTPLWVNSDPRLLTRMVGNLLANAVRYTKRGGILLVARPRGKLVEIQVWDTGEGISAEHVPLVFQEFYQVGNPERDASKGLGLGLSIVAQLGQKLRHAVGVKSRLHRGSVFSITVPRCPVGSYSAKELPIGLPYRPLVAVRSQDVTRCSDICNFLDSWGYERVCMCAHSDEEAVELFKQGAAVVICDSGLLAKTIHDLRGIAAPPKVIAVGEPAQDLDLNFKIDGKVTIPIRPARLRALLHHLIGNEDGEQNDGYRRTQSAPRT